MKRTLSDVVDCVSIRFKLEKECDDGYIVEARTNMASKDHDVFRRDDKKMAAMLLKKNLRVPM